MIKPETSPIWMELIVDRSGEEICVSARSSREESLEPRPLGAGHNATSLVAFAAAVQRAAEGSKALPPELLATALALHKALFDGAIGRLYERLRGAAGGPVLVRLFVNAPELRAVPWEALCKSGEALGFLASSPELHLARGVMGGEAWRRSAVRGAVRVLAVAPAELSGERLTLLKSALAEQIEAGEIEWLAPLKGQGRRDRRADSTPAARHKRARRFAGRPMALAPSVG